MPAAVAGGDRAGRARRALPAGAQRPHAHAVLLDAGHFVEVGETLEDCVHREIGEEAGITVTDVRYFGSQPWPFTGSLMVGFTARWAGGELVPDPEELADAGWFAPDGAAAGAAAAVDARALIDDFVRRRG